MPEQNELSRGAQGVLESVKRPLNMPRTAAIVPEKKAEEIIAGAEPAQEPVPVRGREESKLPADLAATKKIRIATRPLNIKIPEPLDIAFRTYLKENDLEKTAVVVTLLTRLLKPYLQS